MSPPPTPTSAPRLNCIPATRAPVLAVLRRGLSDWFHVGRWDVSDLTFEAGAWFKGTLYPQKCDLSPDGRWLAYSALKYGTEWPAGSIYEAISRLPWLHALAAWEMGTTYTRGFRFVDEPGHSDLGTPDVGDATPCLARCGLRINRAAQFAVERRRGWTETEDTQARDPGDTWDERRSVRMCKRAPAHGAVLYVTGSYGAFRDSPHLRDPVGYTLRWPNATAGAGATTDAQPLVDVQWADWDAAGRLLVATADGALEVRRLTEGGHETIWREDLAPLTPDPKPPPPDAHEW